MKMSNSGFLSLVGFPCILTCSAALARTGIRNASMNIGGMNRTYMVYVPTGLPANPPLVFAIHGVTDNNTMIRNNSGRDAVAQAGKMVAAYPQSNGDRRDPGAGGNDINFFLAIIDTMVRRPPPIAAGSMKPASPWAA